ncbi:hypothetical protein D3C76_1439200 [compost metagenome]
MVSLKLAWMPIPALLTRKSKRGWSNTLCKVRDTSPANSSKVSLRLISSCSMAARTLAFFRVLTSSLASSALLL